MNNQGIRFDCFTTVAEGFSAGSNSLISASYCSVVNGNLNNDFRLPINYGGTENLVSSTSKSTKYSLSDDTVPVVPNSNFKMSLQQSSMKYKLT